MGASVGGAKGGVKAEINITPLVDVVLVLLIIFMVISPGDSTFVQNAIPRKAEIDESVVLSSEQLVLELHADGSAYLNRTMVLKRDFASKIKTIMEQRTDGKLFISVEDELPYGEVVSWMGIAKKHGAKAVALQIKEPTVALAQK